MAKSSFMHNPGPPQGPLCLAVDATAAARPRTGIGHYTASLLQALAVQPGLELAPFTYGLRSRLPLPDGAGRRAAHLALPGKALLLAWHHLGRPAVDALVPGADCVLSPNYLVLPTRRPLMVTVHDVFFMDGQGQDYWSGAFLAAHLRRHLAARAACVLADSEATRQRLLDRLPALEGRVEVVYPGVRELYQQPARPEAQAAARRAQGLPAEYVLCVGELSRRKNQLALLEAYRAAGPDALPPLVLCGMGEAARRAVLARAAGLGLKQGGVLVLPYLEERQVHALLSGARALACPSLDEGFGLVALEALSVGVPVACSAAGSLPEVTGGLAEYFDPARPEHIAEALLAVTSEPAAQEAQRTQGPRWARGFRYAAAAARVHELVREVAGARRV
jgi:glycosyltransferase involved in cell wall biosynthesis